MRDHFTKVTLVKVIAQISSNLRFRLQKGMDQVLRISWFSFFFLLSDINPTKSFGVATCSCRRVWWSSVAPAGPAPANQRPYPPLPSDETSAERFALPLCLRSYEEDFVIAHVHMNVSVLNSKCEVANGTDPNIDSLGKDLAPVISLVYSSMCSVVPPLTRSCRGKHNIF